MRPYKAGNRNVDLDDIESRIDLHAFVGGEAINCIRHNERYPSLHIYDDHVHCFGCGYHDGALHFLQQYWGCSFSAVIQRVIGNLPRYPHVKPKPILPTWEDIKEAAMMLKISPQPRQYLMQTRGLTPQFIDSLWFGWHNHSIVIPHCANGDIVNVKYRPWDGQPKYDSVPNATFSYLWPWDYFRKLYSNSRVCYLTEGEIDAGTLLQESIPSLSLPSGVNTPLFKWLNMFKQFDRVVTLLDMDDPGREAGHRLTKDKNKLGLTFQDMLSPTVLQVGEWPAEWGKDVNDSREMLVPYVRQDYQGVV